MKISEIYKLKKNQRELDFVDIDFPKDLPLFLDPFLIKNDSSQIGEECEECISSFFGLVIAYLKNGNKTAAREIMTNIGEINEIHLGLSANESRGNGVGPINTFQLIESIVESEAVKTGVVEELTDFNLFIKGIGRDKISDLIANVIKKYLIKYTQEQCDIWGIPMTDNCKTGFYWEPNELIWKQGTERMLIIDDKAVLLVPKEFVSFSKTDATQIYYQKFVLEFYQDEYKRIDHYLVKEKRNKKGELIEKYVTKKSIDQDFKNNNITIDKAWLAKFSEDHPEILNKYRKEAVLSHTSVFEKASPEELNDLADRIVDELENTNSGEKEATRYQRIVCGACELIFFPELSNPKMETSIQNGLKRIDITFSNRAKKGFFKRIVEINDIPAHLIMMECKNYSDDVENPEFDQLIGRFSNNRGKIGFLFCRRLNNEEKMIEREKFLWKERQEIVIYIDDSRLIKLLNDYKDTFDDSYNELLSSWMDEIIRS